MPDGVLGKSFNLSDSELSKFYSREKRKKNLCPVGLIKQDLAQLHSSGVINTGNLSCIHGGHNKGEM